MGTATLTVPSAVGWAERWNAIAIRLRQLVTALPARRQLQVQQTTSLGSKASVSLVDVNGMRLLVGVTNGCIRFHPLATDARLCLPLQGTIR